MLEKVKENRNHECWKLRTTSISIKPAIIRPKGDISFQSCCSKLSSPSRWIRLLTDPCGSWITALCSRDWSLQRHTSLQRASCDQTSGPSGGVDVALYVAQYHSVSPPPFALECAWRMDSVHLETAFGSRTPTVVARVLRLRSMSSSWMMRHWSHLKWMCLLQAHCAPTERWFAVHFPAFCSLLCRSHSRDELGSRACWRWPCQSQLAHQEAAQLQRLQSVQKSVVTFRKGVASNFWSDGDFGPSKSFPFTIYGFLKRQSGRDICGCGFVYWNGCFHSDRRRSIISQIYLKFISKMWTYRLKFRFKSILTSLYT